MKEIIKSIRHHKYILLFLDYDGTLVPIKRRPELALLHPRRRRILTNLSEKALLSIVSGRSLPELRTLVGIDNIAYIGNHGMEIYLNDKYWIHPKAETVTLLLKDFLRSIEQKTGDFKGIFIEDKGLTGSIHYRLLAPGKRDKLKDIINEEIRTTKGLLRIAEGKMVYEIRPNLEWDKGKGVTELIRWLDLKKEPLKIYIGDDITDEDVFRVLGKDDLTILVGNREDSNALHRLKDVKEVWIFLKELNKILAT